MSVLIKLAWIFFKIGLLTFGGGYAMLPLIQDELVHTGWMTAEQFANIVGIAEMTPGALSINAATYVGYQQAGIPGALVASISLATPSLGAVLLLAGIFRRLHREKSGQAVFGLLRPVVAGLVVGAAFVLLMAGLYPEPTTGISSGLPDTMPDWRASAIAIVAAFATLRTRLHPAVLIILCGIAGILIFL